MADNSYLPQTGENLELIEIEVQQPCRTYKLDIEKGRVRGTTDNLEALRQAVYLMLSVERYRYPIYSYNYGVELSDLVGMPKDYVMSEAKSRITEALLQDERVNGVDNWNFEDSPKSVIVSFIIHSIYGDIETKKEVNL